MKIKEIVVAWGRSLNPTDEQKETAEKRLEICTSCENATDGAFGPYCKLCGCLFRGKVFSPKETGCPIGKW